MTDEILRIQNIVRPIAQNHGVRRLSLFGSRARGDYRDSSDYDFLISKGNISGMLSYLEFVDDLEDALGTHVDVITDTSEDEEIINAARRDEVVLYERA